MAQLPPPPALAPPKSGRVREAGRLKERGNLAFMGKPPAYREACEHYSLALAELDEVSARRVSVVVVVC